jgi:hypothetical protein
MFDSINDDREIQHRVAHGSFEAAIRKAGELHKKFGHGDRYPITITYFFTEADLKRGR